jgi:dipeptidyl aminopeptidase/acylaminoacyl peptidase
LKSSNRIFFSYNPINFVGDWNTPMLIVHGGQGPYFSGTMRINMPLSYPITDFRIPDSQGIAAFTALQRRGIPSRLLYFAEENHWVLKPQNSLRWHTEVFRWFDEFVGTNSTEGRLVIQA